MAEKRFILSIDGGGIRGLIPAIVLAEIETRLKAAGKAKPLARHFQMIAGTSTGAIIAAGLTCPKGKTKTTPACDSSDLVALYEKEGGDIFPNDFFTQLRRMASNPGSLFNERYDAAPLEKKLLDRLGERKVSEALTTVVMTGYDITARRAVFMTNGKNHDGSPSDDYLFREAARGSSAAPTYFEPALVRNLTQERSEALIDGGMFATDPSLAAAIEGRKQGWSFDDMFILSIGCGRHNRPFAFADVRNWGALSWIDPGHGAPIISILMQGQSSTVAYQMEKLFSGRTRSYFRIDGELLNASDDLDDASPGNLKALRFEAEKMVREHSADIDEFIDLL